MLELETILCPSLVTVSALLVYFVLILNVGKARVKYRVMPPQMTGDPNFERVVRVQQNTVEQLILFLPALWLFSLFVSQLWAGIIGGVWIGGRILFAWGYYQAAEKRTPGFGISSLATIALLAGSLVAIALKIWQLLV